MPVGTAAGEGRCLREPKVVFSFDLADDDWWLEVAMSGISRHEVVMSLTRPPVTVPLRCE